MMLQHIRRIWFATYCGIVPWTASGNNDYNENNCNHDNNHSKNNDNNDKNDTNYNLNDNHDNENGINDNDAKRVQSCTFTLHAAQEILVAPLWPLKASRPQRHEPHVAMQSAWRSLCTRRCSSSKRVPVQIATNTKQKLPNSSEAVLVWNSSVSLSLTLTIY